MKKLIATIQNDEILVTLDNQISYISFGALDRGNVSDTINWGCYSNAGEIEFYDTYHQFETLIPNIDTAIVRILYRSNDKSVTIASFYIEDYEYNRDSPKVILKLTDRLNKLQEQYIEKYYPTLDSATLYSVWNSVVGQETLLTNSVAEKMKSTTIDIPYLQEGSKWETINKICKASMTRCFANILGMPVISDEIPSSDVEIIIKPKNILSIENYVPPSKTSISDCSISAHRFTKKYNEPLVDNIEFTWYYVNGTTLTSDAGPVQYHLVADWAENPGSFRLLVNDNGEQDYFGVVSGFALNLPEHFLSFGDPEITISKTVSDKSVGAVRTISYRNAEITAKIETDEINSSEARIIIEKLRAIDKVPDSKGAAGNFVFTNGVANWRGNFFSDNGKVRFGSSSKSAQEVETNELIQSESAFGDKLLAQHIIDTVEEKYSNGVECVVMEVTPSDYYDEYRHIVIGDKATKPLFEKYDIVTPYVIRNGYEKPYSIDKEGNAKKFTILGVEYDYAGFLKQRLYLQEVTS